jgi:hypothetical protein
MPGEQNSGEMSTQLAELQELKKLREQELLGLPGVQAVGIGYKVVGGKETGELSIVVYVDKKLPKKDLGRGGVPGTLSATTETQTVPTATRRQGPTTPLKAMVSANTDVKEVGVIEAQVYNARIRPVKPGYSIGHYKITAGTFGALVRDICPPCKVHILSNNHVLANSNAAAIGDPILQPGAYDGGTLPGDTVARLTRFVPISFGSPDRYNLVDAALATPLDQRLVIASAVGLGIPRGTVEATLGMEVTKSGRTTQTTVGKVIDVNATVAVNYGASGVAYYRNQIITTAMSAGGDSGSLVVDKAGGRGTGLLFAGSDQITILNSIQNVLMALGVELITA